MSAYVAYVYDDSGNRKSLGPTTRAKNSVAHDCQVVSDAAA
ncbi:hypothetical protein [Gordonia sp. (in: high G+C Gram-positive bacteria)]